MYRRIFLHQAGVTLIEMIVVIVVSGILMSLVGMFIRNQVDSYTDVTRRAEIVDAMDGTLRRMARDIQKALPNSVRTPLNEDNCVEFIPTKAGGRYRAEGVGALDFPTAGGAFHMYGPNSGGIVADDLLAVYNLGIPGADAFAKNNIAKVTKVEQQGANTATEETKITVESWPAAILASPSNRFHVIPGIPVNEPVVSYLCSPVGGAAASAPNGLGTLYRYTRSLSSAQPNKCPIATVVAGKVFLDNVETPSAVVLAENISTCAFAYSPGVHQHTALLEITLETKRDYEPVTLRELVNVMNTP